MSCKCVAVEGNIGAGKTTLVHALRSLGHATQNEEVNTPFLKHLYTHKDSAFAFQIYMLMCRVHVLTLHARTETPLYIDRSLFGDRCFAIVNYMLRNISAAEFDLYTAISNEKGGVDEHVIYLHTPYEVCYGRMQSRGRDAERGVSLDYLRLVEDVSIMELLLRAKNGGALTVLFNNDSDAVNSIHQPQCSNTRVTFADEHGTDRDAITLAFRLNAYPHEAPNLSVEFKTAVLNAFKLGQNICLEVSHE